MAYYPNMTQIMQDNPTPNNIYRVDGANHLEVTDMSNSPQGDLTKDQFDDIFDSQVEIFLEQIKYENFLNRLSYQASSLPPRVVRRKLLIYKPTITE